MTTFEIDQKKYVTDQETIAVLRSLMPGAEASGDSSAIAVVMHLGLNTGRIRELGTGVILFCAALHNS